jgi:ABC-type bacteriocin/lantibiotic exporter with double-glycine peptidase domain
VVGKVGAGKTSLLAALLGELQQLEGAVSLEGSVAYCAQQPWLTSATVRDNICFKRPFEHERYWATVRACALTPDLEQLVAGDQTMVGERGLTLSGGQKQRIALARAVYRQAAVLLLDDVLAAVDVHVGHYLFEHCICGAMAGATRIVVTNSLGYFSKCDKIAVVAENGNGEATIALDVKVILPCMF